MNYKTACAYLRMVGFEKPQALYEYGNVLVNTQTDIRLVHYTKNNLWTVSQLSSYPEKAYTLVKQLNGTKNS